MNRIEPHIMEKLLAAHWKNMEELIKESEALYEEIDDLEEAVRDLRLHAVSLERLAKKKRSRMEKIDKIIIEQRQREFEDSFDRLVGDNNGA